MKKVYLVYRCFSDNDVCVVKVFHNEENANRYVVEKNKCFFMERDVFWYVDMKVADYSETIQNDEKF